ncbi:MAG: SUMF1/EgtB/PvdO family nonheme iron enzyme [Treponema sp.]|nr:SUMF1/EgtB/PvdO family nonheme iron enzyme [Treponema sp.]
MTYRGLFTAVRRTKKSVSSAKKSEVGAASGSNRVKRGGSWNNNANNCRVANRNNNNPNNRNNNIGFRLVRSAQLSLMHGRAVFTRMNRRSRVGQVTAAYKFLVKVSCLTFTHLG